MELFLQKNANISAKRMLTSTKLRAPWYVLESVFSKTTYACVLMYQLSAF